MLTNISMFRGEEIMLNALHQLLSPSITTSDYIIWTFVVYAHACNRFHRQGLWEYPTVHV